jgi:hypothetical protein
VLVGIAKTGAVCRTSAKEKRFLSRQIREQISVQFISALGQSQKSLCSKGAWAGRCEERPPVPPTPLRAGTPRKIVDAGRIACRWLSGLLGYHVDRQRHNECDW